jgi:hypothetical protein
LSGSIHGWFLVMLPVVVLTREGESSLQGTKATCVALRGRTLRGRGYCVMLIILKISKRAAETCFRVTVTGNDSCFSTTDAAFQASVWPHGPHKQHEFLPSCKVGH